MISPWAHYTGRISVGAKQPDQQPNADRDQEGLDRLFLDVVFNALFQFRGLLAALLVISGGLVADIAEFLPRRSPISLPISRTFWLISETVSFRSSVADFA